MSIQWCHSQATCESFFAFILKLSTIDYLASRVPGHTEPYSPSPTDSELVGAHDVRWTSVLRRPERSEEVPNPYVQNLRFGCASLGDTCQESQIPIFLLSGKMKKDRPGAPAIFADTRAGVLNVPVPAAVSGQLHFPCAPLHREKRYFPVR